MASSSSLSPQLRVLRARQAAHVMHAAGKTNTGPATAAQLARFEREVDPDGTLDPAERERRAAHARKAYFTSLAYRSVKARQRDRSPDSPESV